MLPSIRAAARFLAAALTPFSRAMNALSVVGGVSVVTIVGLFASPLWAAIAGLSLMVIAVTGQAVRAELRAESRPVRLVSPPISTAAGGRHWRFHISQGERGVDLHCEKNMTPVPTSLQCWVTDPEGHQWQGTVHYVGDLSAATCYPPDFDVQAKTGRHSVKWLRRTGKQDESGRWFVQNLMPFPETLDFTIER